MKANEDLNPVEVYSGSSVQAGMVKSLLESEGINAYLKDEFIGTLAPWYSSAGGAGAVKIFVSGKDYEKAIQLLKDAEVK